MEEITQLLTVEIDQKAVQKSIDAIAEATDSLNELKDTQAKLKKAGGESSEQFIKNNVAIKSLNDTIRQNNNVLKANEKAQQANTGSITQMREQLKIVSKQWADLSKEERENEEIGGKLAKQKKELTDLLKKEEKATGDTRRNVGNYTDSIEDALNGTNAFGTGLTGMISGLKGATAASLKFLATPLGAVIGALGLAIGGVVGLFNLFTKSLNRTEKGQATLSKVTQTFSAIMNGVLKVLEPLATTVMEGVANGFDLIGKAAGKASGILQKGLKFLGLDGAAENVKAYTDSIEESVKSTRELADAQLELNKIEREQEQIQLAFQNRAEKLRQIRDDEAKSIEERIKANEDLGKVLDEQLQNELSLANKALEIAQLRAKVEGESKENLDAIADAQTKILEIDERITGQRSEQLVNINSLKKEQKEAAEEAEKLRLEAIEKEEAENEGRRRRRRSRRAKTHEEEMQAADEAIEQRLEKLAFETEETTRIEIEGLQERFLQGLISKEEYEQSLTDIENAALAARQINAMMAIEEARNNELISEQQRVEIIRDAENEIAAIKKQQTDAAIANKLAEMDVDQEVAVNKLSLAQNVLSGIVDILGQESAAGKAAASFSALISTYQGAAASLKEGGIFGIIQAAIITATGLASVAKINSTPEPKLPSASSAGGGGGAVRGARRSRSFAVGGYTGEGVGSPDSSGYKPAGIVHEGEYVVKKSMVESPMFNGIISDLESYRLKGYADGGFVGRSASSPINQGREIASLKSDILQLSKRPIITRISDIQRVEGQVSKVVSDSSLVG